MPGRCHRSHFRRDRGRAFPRWECSAVQRPNACPKTEAINHCILVSSSSSIYLNDQRISTPRPRIVLTIIRVHLFLLYIGITFLRPPVPLPENTVLPGTPGLLSSFHYHSSGCLPFPILPICFSSVSISLFPCSVPSISTMTPSASISTVRG